MTEIITKHICLICNRTELISEDKNFVPNVYADKVFFVCESCRPKYRKQNLAIAQFNAEHSNNYFKTILEFQK